MVVFPAGFLHRRPVFGTSDPGRSGVRAAAGDMLLFHALSGAIVLIAPQK
jgi:hypothetical protein